MLARWGLKHVGFPVTLGRSGTKPKRISNLWKASVSVPYSRYYPPCASANEDSAETVPQSNSHVFNAGSPVWGLDWCPIHPDDRESGGDAIFVRPISELS